MNKKFLSAILFGALVASTGSFVSCADNDDDIKQLQDQNSELKAQLAALKTDLQAQLKEAASASQVAAIEAKLSAIESATADNMKATVDALNGKFDTQEAKIVAINTQLKALEGLQGVDAKELISALEKAKENGNADITTLSAMVDALDAQINTMTGKLCGLVFQPEFYVDGIEAAEYTYLQLIPLAGDADKYTNAKWINKYDENWNYVGYEPGQYDSNANPVQIYDEKFVWGYAHYGDIYKAVLGTYEDNSSKTGFGEGYSAKDKDGNMRGIEVYGDGVVNKMVFAMNPSNARPSKEDLAFISKNVAAYTRGNANGVDPTVVDIKAEGGYLTVLYTISDGQIKNLITANNREDYSLYGSTTNGVINRQPNTTIVKLQAANDEEASVESDWAALYETSIQPVAVAINAKAVSAGWYAPIGYCQNWNYDDNGNATTPINGRELDKNPFEALARYDNTFSLMYNDEKGVDLADFLDIHMVKRSNDPYRFGGNSNGTGYTTAHQHISLAEAQEMYGLTVEFKMVPYTTDGNKTRPSNYLTLTEATSKGHVVANIVDEKTGEAKAGVQGVSSVGKQPLVQVLVKHGNDVVLDAYIRILIDRALEFKTLPEPIDLGSKAYDCSGKINFADQWYQTSTLLYEWIGMSRNEFHNNYYLAYDYYFQEVDGYYNWAEAPNDRYIATQFKSTISDTKDFYGSVIAPENCFARVLELRDNEQNTNATVSVELDPAAQRYVWEQPNHSAVINVVYRPNYGDGVNTSREYLIVPLKITIDAPAAALTWVEKDPNYWYAADGLGEDGLESIRMNVNEPTDNGSTVPFVSYVKNTLMGNTVKFMSGDKEFQFANKATAKSKFYFHPFTNGVVVENEYTKEKYYLSVKNNWVECNIWDKTTVGAQADKYPYTSVTKEHVNTGNANDGWSAGQNLFTAEETQAVEAKHMLDANKGIYTNTELFAHTKYVDHNDEDKVKDNEPVLIATIDADGKIVYENNPTAKAVLNATSHKNPTAMAYVGVIATDQCDETTLPVANNVFPVYFLRPLDIDKNDVDINVDANDNGAEFSLFDKVAFTDWRDQPFVKSQDPKYTNIWYMAYYNVNTITVDFDKVTTTLGNGELGKTLLKDVSTAVKFYFMDGTTVKADNLSASAEPAKGSIEKNWSAYDKASMGVESTYDAFVKHFGTIKYSNNNSTVKTFQVRIPVTFGYDWGEVTTELDVTLKNTMGN